MPALSEIRDAVERDWRASRRAALDAALSAGTAE